jgi:hypothetical protein
LHRHPVATDDADNADRFDAERAAPDSLVARRGPPSIRPVASIARLPPPVHTVAEAQAALAGPDPASTWFYGATFVGGPYAKSGQIAQGILDFTPGDWLLWADQSADTAPPVLTVTAAATTSTSGEPPITTNFELSEYAFGGVEQGVPAGPQTWKFTNIGEQPHLVDVVKAPRGVMFHHVMTLLMMPDGATPPAGVPPVEAYEGIAGIGTISPGKTAWLIMPDLERGTYVAMCFVPDREQGAPHALMGMVQIFTVGETAAPIP